MPKGTRHSIDRKKCWRLYKSGMLLRDIATEVGCAMAQVGRVIAELRHDLPPPVTKQRRCLMCDKMWETTAIRRICPECRTVTASRWDDEYVYHPW